MSRRRQCCLVLLLAAAALAAFWPVLDGGFVNIDDDVYVIANPPVLHGLSAPGVRWAFSTVHGGLWQPLTWLSHMLDAELYGSDPPGHHLTSLLLHAANTGLVFLVLHRLTGAGWRSALAAGLFGLHPLRVESVAWVAERKDVLSGCLALLSLWAWTAYARTPRAATYLLSLASFALGLMAKPMLVTLPCVMLLLDVWPLRRRALLEKLPFFALTVLAGGVALVAGAAQVERYPLAVRLANVLLSYGRYLAKTLWPADLAVFYPYPRAFAPWQLVASGMLLAAITVWVWRERRRAPALLVGWLWFAGMLVPVIGFVQPGPQALADRYTYLPAIGTSVLLVWGGHEVARRLSVRPSLAASFAVAALAALGAATWTQVHYWRDSGTLFTRALAVTRDNWLAHNNLGSALMHGGDVAGAEPHFREAIRIEPRYADAYYNLGVALMAAGRLDEAAEQYRATLRLRPERANARTNLGLVLLKLGHVDAAVDELGRALALGPNAVSHYNLGLALARRGDEQEAARHYTRALALRPDFVPAREQLEARAAR